MSNKEMDHVTVRRATHADCDDIKAIDRNLHDGFDRLLYYFHYDVNAETKFSYVAEIEGKIVGYATGHVIDDGDAIVMRDGRVMKKYRGNKAMVKLGLAIMSSAMARFPNLRWRVMMSNNDVAVGQARETYPSLAIPLSLPFGSFQVQSDKLKTLCESEAFSLLKIKYQVDDIISLPKYQALKLLTEEIRYLDFAPERPMIGWQPSGWHASTLGNQLQVTDLFISKCQNTNTIQAFSFVTTLHCDVGVKTGIEFYCDPQARVEDLTMAHILHFIRELARFHSYTNINAYFHHPTEVSHDFVREVLNVQLGVPDNGSNGHSNIEQFDLHKELGHKSKL